MISSKVQRTLVKSPPELWAELGDPASLARHLGELGEIRITRFRPEEAIEWEAEDTTGTVLIKPSGWGTKVTLTATREIPTPEPPLAAQSPSEHQAEARPAAELEPQPQAQPQVEPEPIARAEVQPQPTAQAKVGGTAEAQRAPGATAVVAEPTAVSEPEPIAPAEPSAQAEVVGEPKPEQLSDAAVAVDEPSESNDQLLPRRGFFSRLFGRRQRQTAVAIAPQPAEPCATVPKSEPLSEGFETVWNVEPRVYDPYEPGAHTGPELVGPTDTGVCAEPEPSAPGKTVAPALEQPTEAWGTAASAESQPEGPLQPVCDLERPPDAEETTAEQVHAPVQSANAQPTKTASELEQAEAGEVTAVLTGVLDRLGAAHHRPFSRS